MCYNALEHVFVVKIHGWDLLVALGSISQMTADEVFWNQVRGGLMMLVAINERSPARSLELKSALMVIVRAIETRHPGLVPSHMPGRSRPHRAALLMQQDTSEESEPPEDM